MGKLSDKALRALVLDASKVRPLPWERQSASRVMDANYTEVADLFDPEIAALLARAPEICSELAAARKVVRLAARVVHVSPRDYLAAHQELDDALDAYDKRNGKTGGG